MRTEPAPASFQGKGGAASQEGRQSLETGKGNRNSVLAPREGTRPGHTLILAQRDPFETSDLPNYNNKFVLFKTLNIR